MLRPGQRHGQSVAVDQHRAHVRDRCSAARPRRPLHDSVPRATSGAMSSEDVVVSVKRAVSVFKPALAACPAPIQLVERRVRRGRSCAEAIATLRDRRGAADERRRARGASRCGGRVGAGMVAMVTSESHAAIGACRRDRRRVSRSGLHTRASRRAARGAQRHRARHRHSTRGCRSTLAATVTGFDARRMGLADEAAADGPHRRVRDRCRPSGDGRCSADDFCRWRR